MKEAGITLVQCDLLGKTVVPDGEAPDILHLKRIGTTQEGAPILHERRTGRMFRADMAYRMERTERETYVYRGEGVR